MKAKIRDVGFSPDTIIIGVDFYFSKGEAGYEQCWVDIPDRPEEYEGEPVPTHKELTPFRSISLSFPAEVTRQTVTDAITEKLRAFKRAYSKVGLAQEFVGEEYHEE